jgi:hypothetical protein
MRLTKNGREIRTVGDWREIAPPKRPAVQWKQGRSAAELAAAWCGSGQPQVPQQLVDLLASHPDTAGCQVVEGWPEHAIPFDRHGGEPRNADLALEATLGDLKIAITIEAKADEEFGKLTGEVLADAVDRGLVAHSNGVQRVRDLAAALLPPRGDTAPPLPPLSAIRYQLLTAAAGTLAFAISIGAPRAVLIVHEFVTDQTRDERHDANRRDLEVFLRRLSAGADSAVVPGQMLGPYRVPGGAHAPAPELYLGKIVSDLRVPRVR